MPSPTVESANPSDAASQGSRHEQQRHGEAEHRDPRAGSPEQHAEHGDRRHRRRAHDARLGRHQQHEPDERRDAAGDPRPSVPRKSPTGLSEH